MQPNETLLMPVVVGVMLARFLRVVRGVVMMAVRYVRVVPGFLVVSVGVMFSSGAMMPRGVLVMFGSFQVVIGDLFGHNKVPFWEFDFVADRGYQALITSRSHSREHKMAI